MLEHSSPGIFTYKSIHDPNTLAVVYIQNTAKTKCTTNDQGFLVRGDNFKNNAGQVTVNRKLMNDHT